MKIDQTPLFIAIIRHLDAAGVPAMEPETYNRILDATNQIVDAVDELPEPAPRVDLRTASDIGQ